MALLPTRQSVFRGSWAASGDRGGFGRIVERLSLRSPAWLAVVAALALSLISVYAIDVAERLADPGMQAHGVAWLSPIAMRQLTYLAVGLCAACVVAVPHYRWAGYFAPVLYVVTVGLLVFLLIPFVPTWLVRPRNGARGWIDLGAFDLQPAELAKIATVLAIAAYMKYRDSHRKFLGLMGPGVIVAIPVLLITLEPDLGNALLFAPVLFAMLVAAGAKLKHMAIVVLLAACVAPATFPLLKQHQKQRIVGLIKQFNGDTSADQDINMQSVTAQRMIGAGGAAGNSDEASRRLLKYNSLPERHNDMIYAVIVNRFGFFGGVALLLIYALWTLAALATAVSTTEPFGRLAAVGFAIFIPTQVFVNVGMNVGLVPIIGITLPFVSYGGTSLVVCWMMVGLLVSIGMRRPKATFRASFEYTRAA
jgi:cell division protein FtsW (lipid II flippase)